MDQEGPDEQSQPINVQQFNQDNDVQANVPSGFASVPIKEQEIIIEEARLRMRKTSVPNSSEG